MNNASDSINADVNAFLLTVNGPDIVDIERTLSPVGKYGSSSVLRVAVVYRVS